MAAIRNRLLDFLAGEVSSATAITMGEAKDGFLGLSREDAQLLLDAINASDEQVVGQIVIQAARAAHDKRARDLVVNALSDEELTFREVLGRLENL